MAHLELIQDIVESSFGKKAFPVRHKLSQDPLFELPSLADLAEALPLKNLRYHFNNQDVHSDYRWIRQAQFPKNSSINKLVKDIKDGKSLMVLKYVESNDLFRQRLYELLDQVKLLSEAVEPGMSQREGFIFITSPHQVTPFHLDPEHNFLLQISGSKSVHIFDPSDQNIVSSRDLEKYFSSHWKENVGNLTYQSAMEGRGCVYELKSGDGLYFPPLAPHWVQNGPEYSISFSITFRTLASKKRGAAYAVNERLRRWGLRPKDPGQQAQLDSFKYHAYRMFSNLAGLFDSKKS